MEMNRNTNARSLLKRSEWPSELTARKPGKWPLAVTASLAIGLASSLTLANTFNIDVSETEIAVQANNASLKELLQELERLTGIPVKFVADTDERVSLNVGLTSVENAIGKITPNHMIVHEDKQGKKVIKELIIIPNDSGTSGGGADSSFLPNGQPAPAIEPQLEQPQLDQPQAMPAPGAQPLAPTEQPITDPNIPVN